MYLEQKSPEETIKGMKLEDAYNTLLLEIDDEEGETIKKQARYGINIKFDLYEWLEDTMHIKEKKGVVLRHGKKYKLSHILTELENRNVTIKKYLLGKVKRTMLISARG